jgi:hypothetical protein
MGSIELINAKELNNLNLNSKEYDEILNDIKTSYTELDKNTNFDAREIWCRINERYFILTLYYELKENIIIYYKDGREVGIDEYIDTLVKAKNS